MIRAAVRARLTDRIKSSAKVGGAVVSVCHPGSKNVGAEMVFGDRTTGAVGFPYAMEPPRIQRDQFTVTYVVSVTASPNLDAAMVRCEELANEVIRALETDTGLIGFTHNGEQVTDTNPDGVGIQVETKEGETAAKSIVALAEITVPIETQTVNAQEG